MLFEQLTERTPVLKGWSGDKKYCAANADGTKYLLRISPPERYEERKALYEQLKRVEELEIPMCRPVEFGVCSEGVYMLYTWVEGCDAEETVPFLPEREQYSLGTEAGKLLKKLHALPAPDGMEAWHTRFSRKTDRKIQKYRACGIRFEGDEHVLNYLAQNRRVIQNRPQCFQHGDYHIGNMMLENGKLVVIDFDRFDFGDPWEEFNRIVWCAQAAPLFAGGMIDGYFEQGTPPLQFWQCLAFYIGSNTLSSVYWALDFGEDELHTMLRQAQDVLHWYDNMRTVVPCWYRPQTGNV